MLLENNLDIDAKWREAIMLRDWSMLRILDLG